MKRVCLTLLPLSFAGLGACSASEAPPVTETSGPGRTPAPTASGRAPAAAEGAALGIGSFDYVADGGNVDITFYDREGRLLGSFASKRMFFVTTQSLRLEATRSVLELRTTFDPVAETLTVAMRLDGAEQGRVRLDRDGTSHVLQVTPPAAAAPLKHMFQYFTAFSAEPLLKEHLQRPAEEIAAHRAAVSRGPAKVDQPVRAPVKESCLVTETDWHWWGAYSTYYSRCTDGAGFYCDGYVNLFDPDGSFNNCYDVGSCTCVSPSPC